MDKIQNISQIMEIVRSQISNKSSSNTKKGAVNLKTKQAGKHKRISQDELKNNISKRIKSLNNSETRDDSAREIFLESIILWEFGENIANDPFFAELKSKILLALKENKETSAKLDKIIEQLSNSCPE